MVSLNTLRSAAQPILSLAREEIEFSVEEVTVSLRLLRPKEEVDVQRYLTRDGADPENMEATDALAYFFEFRVEVLAYAIMQINDTNLRDTPYIETDEVLDNGKPVRVPKHAALRELLSDWPREIITIAFAKYGELSSKAAEKSEKFLVRGPAEIDAEIERLQNRLRSLQQERVSRFVGGGVFNQEVLQNFVTQGTTLDLERNRNAAIGDAASDAMWREETEPAPEVEEPTPEPEPEPEPIPEPEPEPIPMPPPAARQPRRPVIPPVVPPPVSDAPASAVSTLDDFISSFGHDEIAEEQRLASRVVRDPLSQATPVGKVGQMDVYRLPAETISDRGRNPAPRGPGGSLQTDQPPQQGAVNPNFRPPKR